MNTYRPLLHRIYLVLQPILMVAVVLAYLQITLSDNPNADPGLLTTAIGLFVFSGLFTMFFTGTFRKTIFGKLSYIVFALIIIAQLFRLQHWPGAGAIGLTASVTLALLYLLHFLRKKKKTSLDWLKLIYVLVLCSSYFIEFLYLPVLYLKSIVHWMVALLTNLFFYLHIRHSAHNPEDTLPLLSEKEQELFDYEE
jgi:hypothetical protein